MKNRNVKPLFLASVVWSVLTLPLLADWLDPMDFPSLGSLILSDGEYYINTDGPSPVILDSQNATLFTGTVHDTGSSQPVAVFDFRQIIIGNNATIIANGENPLALLSQTTATIAGTFIASGHDGSNGAGAGADGLGGNGGPGGWPGGKGGVGNGNGNGRDGSGIGAGLGGSSGSGNRAWGTGAGFGGRGGDGSGVFNSARLSNTYGNLLISLEGGSGGGGSGANTFNSIGAGGGGGGGAVEFGTKGSMTVAADIFVDGGRGGEGQGILAGGGSGGGLLFHGTDIFLTPSATISARGGGPFGGGGRVDFLTNTGRIFQNLATLSVDAGSGNGEQQPGVISMNAFSGVVREIPGDFNRDNFVNVTDVDLLVDAIHNNQTDAIFDLNKSGAVDREDLGTMVEVILNTTYGDANLDGRFDSSDLVKVFQANEYEDNVIGNSTWSEGDWNGDRDATTSDLALAFQTGAFEQRIRVAVPVPETVNGIWLSIVAFLAVSRSVSRCRT